MKGLCHQLGQSQNGDTLLKLNSTGMWFHPHHKTVGGHWWQTSQILDGEIGISVPFYVNDNAAFPVIYCTKQSCNTIQYSDAYNHYYIVSIMYDVMHN